MAIIEVDHVTKEFQLGQLRTLKTVALDRFRKLVGKPVETRSPFKALDDVSFSVRQGEVLGIIGQNGAGKSTLLKLLANISHPTSGRIAVKGKVAPLIEVGAGLVLDLTGRENIYLNGSILGIAKAEIARRFDDIVAFAELEEFIDTPIKRYSSGMQVRLGFSIATSVKSDILIVDEVLAVGDLAFQRKCLDRMEAMIKREGKTVLLVSHNIRHVERLCTRVLILDRGRMIADGAPDEVCGLFFARTDEKIRSDLATQKLASRHASSGDAELLGVQVLDGDGVPTDVVRYRGKTTLRARFNVKTTLTNPSFGFGIHTPDLIYLATDISDSAFMDRILEPGVYTVSYDIPHFPFLPGVYSIRLGFTSSEGVRENYYAENVAHIQIMGDDTRRPQAMREGFVLLGGTWQLDAENAQNARRLPDAELSPAANR